MPDIIKFPKAKRPRPLPIDNDLAAMMAKAASDALVNFAADCRAARERGDVSPAMKQAAAVASLFPDD